MLALNQAEIYPGVHYRDNTLYGMYAYARGSCPRAHLASDQVISLPMHIRLSYTDASYVAETLKKIVCRLGGAAVR
jgi:dTDP-4-amino-4,6-dideoxygalactose transaminase